MRARGGTKGSPSAEWCRLPFGVAPRQRLQVLRPSGQAPMDSSPAGRGCTSTPTVSPVRSGHDPEHGSPGEPDVHTRKLSAACPM